MKKVLLIAEAMLGGLRQHVFDIARGLDKEKFEVYLLYSENRADDKFYEEIEEVGKDVKLIKCNEMERSIGFHDIKAYRKIIQYIKEINPDIVHCHSSKAGIVGRLAAKAYGVPVILYTPNAYAFQSPECSFVKKEIYILAERYLSRRACSMTINVSKGEMEKALEYKIDVPEKFTLIYNGIPEMSIPDKEKLRERLGLKQNIRYVGFTGRCTKQKDPMTFLEIAKQVIAKRNDTEFLYIGDGELQEQMQAWIEGNKLSEKIHMLGFRNDSSEIVGALDIYLSTALYEGLPYSMIEAMRAGVPIIATNCVGNNELVFEGNNGMMFPIGDVETACRLIERQINEQVIATEKVRDTFMKEFSLDTMMSKLVKIFGGRVTCNKLIFMFHTAERRLAA